MIFYAPIAGFMGFKSFDSLEFFGIHLASNNHQLYYLPDFTNAFSLFNYLGYNSLKKML